MRSFTREILNIDDIVVCLKDVVDIIISRQKE